MYATTWLVGCGVPDAQIMGILLNPLWSISETVLECKGYSPEAYARRQVSRAKAHVKAETLEVFEDEFEARRLQKWISRKTTIMKVETLAEVPALWDKLGELAVLKHKERSKYETLLIQLQALGYSRTAELDREVTSRLRAAKKKQKSAQASNSNWPRALPYDPDDDALNAKLFLGSRPGQLIAIGKEFFSTFETEQGATLWRSVTDLALGHEIAQTDKGNRLRSKVLTATINRVRFSVQSDVRPFEWIAAPENAPEPNDTALFRNGLLNVKTGELLRLDGSFFATAVPDFDYIPEAKCPSWLAWLDKRLGREYHATLQEILGYLLTPDSQFHRFFSFVGPPRSGKGRLRG